MIAPIFLAPFLLAPAPLRCVIFGGGPSPEYNQVAIESNVRYVYGLLPTQVSSTILFADGQTDTPIVQFLATKTEAQKSLRTLFGDGPRPAKGAPFLQYRKSDVPRRDGASTSDTVTGIFEKLAGEGDKAPLMLYFTGHGSPGRQSYDNNRYDLWGNSALTTTALAGHLEKLPAKRPVTVVMVQCFSGAFGNLLFAGGLPEGELTNHPLCGFFATVKEREAAGCTPEVEEEEYHDFTSYFFAALTGKDRLGRKSVQPDYNKDGKVGMDEAFAWTQINEESIDVPVVTSDVFLRRFVPIETDEEITAISWDELKKAATPAQRAALEGLSEKLGPTAQGEDRVKVAYERFRKRVARDMKPSSSGGIRLEPDVQKRYAAARQDLNQRFPSLGNRRATSEEWKEAVAQANTYLEERPTQLADLAQVRLAVEEASKGGYAKDIEDARWFRFVRIAKSVVLEMRLRKSGDKVRLKQLEALRKLESQNPLSVR
ncbi:hypothetical protein [Armatimonas sp.]|uniref:hypothetical protein n=1 Tax=Armatimonas sp. TaxID=1872638 RepID=UPI0037509F23